MKIVHYYPRMTAATGGPYTGIVSLAQLMAKRGHEVLIISRSIDPSLLRVLSATPLISCAKFDARVWRGALKAGLLDSVLSDADVVHIHGMWSPSASMIAWLARADDVPYLVSLRGMMRSWSMERKRWKKLPYWHLAGRRLLLDASVIHVTAFAELKEARDFIGPHRYEEIPNFFDAVQYVPRSVTGPRRASGGIRLCSLGRLHQSKGVDRLLRALALLHPDMQKRIEICIAGTGDLAYERYLQSLPHSLRLTCKVEWLGRVTGQDKIDLLQQSDALISLTYTENFGFALFEALAAGAHVVTTSRVATAGQLVESGNATLVEDELGLADLLSARLVNGFDAGARRAGIDYVRQMMDPELIADRWESVLESLASTNP